MVVIGDYDVIINANVPNSTIRGHVMDVIKYFENAPQIPFDAIAAAETSVGVGIDPRDIQVMEKTDDLKVMEKFINPQTKKEEEKEVHYLGACVFRVAHWINDEIVYDYYLSSIDESAWRKPYFLVRLESPAHNVKEALYQISGLTAREYSTYRGKIEAEDGRVKIKRQGEYFFHFIGSSAELRDYIGVGVDYPLFRKFLQKDRDIAEVFRPDHEGNKHVAEYVLVISGQVFVSGYIEHREHHNFNLSDWYLVSQNNVLGAWTAVGDVD
jgi:hypothetical protein